MSHRPWPERVEHELVRRGVPVRFRHRLLAELRDHVEDLKEGEGLIMTEEMSSDRLGEPATLAAEAAEQYRLASWTSRHPLVVFGLLPVPTTIVVFAVTLLLLGLGLYGTGWALAGNMDNLPRPTLFALTSTLAWVVRFFPFAVLAMLFTRLYLRSQVSRWWLLCAAAQVLLIAGSTVSSIQCSEVPGQSQYQLGFAMPSTTASESKSFLQGLGWSQVFQVAVPMVVGVLMYRTARRRQAEISVVC